ncbi:MAG: hypothetical protein K2W95_28055 [Candidatus Obscuribacterales bacterium]|nr:hypothetical protein [Candidatus Obscuribacterales bacterium]
MKRVIFCLTLSLSVVLAGGSALCQGSASAGPALGLLEQKYFEHSYDSDPVAVRVARLEKLIYGDARTGNISERLAVIVGLVARESETPVVGSGSRSAGSRGYAPALAAKPDTSDSAAGAPNGTGQRNVFNYTPVTSFGSTGSSPAQPTAPVVDSGDYGNYPHVTVLENEILGTSYQQDSLPARLSRLELRAFGKDSAGSDLGSRTDALEQYAETKLHKKAFGINPRMQENSDQMLPEMSSAGAPPAPRPHVDSPEVFAVAPPPSSSQMLTRVGWCEYQLFGHTFPTMHLMARLRQLHDEVVPNKLETNLQLLDDMDALTNAVVARVQQKKNGTNQL